MNNKKTLILIMVFVALIAGASVLYNSMSDNFKMDTLVAYDENEENGINENVTDENTKTADENIEQGAEETTAYAAPDFTVIDESGKEHKLSDFIGKPIVLNFWASWCGPCKSEMPDFNETYAEYKDDINFLMVNLTDGSRETVETASDYVKGQGYSFPVYYDTMSEAAMTYSVYSVPTTYFVDENGNLIAQARGAIDKETLLRGIGMIYGN